MNKFFHIEKKFNRLVIHLFFFRITLRINRLLNLQQDVKEIKKVLMDTKFMSGYMGLYVHQEIILELILDKLYLSNCQKKNHIKQVLTDSKSIAVSYWADNKPQYIFDCLPYLFHTTDYNVVTASHAPHADCYCMWGTQPFNGNITLIKNALYENKPLLILESGFISNIESWGWMPHFTKYNQTVSFIVDDLSPYYDARRASRLETMLENSSLKLTSSQILRAKSLIQRILSNHISKYNHQPIYKPNIGRKNTTKVLVIDQCYGDMSITKGGASEQTFKEMLQAAIDENPDADIIVKTHPDTISGARGYLTKVKRKGNIYPFTKAINPISLLSIVDKVYVCTSQIGFEALMLGKEVHVFGLPFYSGWGLTHDRQSTPRRTNSRSIEELFYITYIKYTHYVLPTTKTICDLEAVIDYILVMREQYFKEKNYAFLN